MTNPEIFDQNLDAFRRHQRTPWMKLRYDISAANLERHIPLANLSILDAGGGNGVEAIACARLGNRVTLVDTSAAMLAEARTSAAAGKVDIRILQGGIQDLTKLLPEDRFDLALCHNVIQYVEKPEEVLRPIHTVLKPGGMLSLICINRYSETIRLALQELDLPGALDAIDKRVVASKVFDAPMRCYSMEELATRLEASGFAVLGKYGIRCLNDYIPDNNLKSDPAFFDQLERLELALSDRYPYFLIARSCQIIARKATP